MTDYTTTSTHAEVAARLRSASKVALVTHSKPDGDAIGSVLALARVCSALEIDATCFLMGPLQPNLLALAGPNRFVVLEGDRQEPPVEAEPDTIVICDTGASSQLEPISGWIAARLEKTIILDHHVNGDLAASMRIVDAGAASATLIVFDLLPHLDVVLTGGPFGIAEALLLGIATDTGWFKFNNADPRAFRAAATLIEAGADKGRLHTIVEENDRPARLALKARALLSLQLIADEQAAIMTLSPQDFSETSAVVEDLVAIVNEPLSIGSVRVSALLTSTERGSTKISLRSKPPIESNNGRIGAIDVNRVAARFGGGGHVHAAGARVDLPLERAVHDVRTALEAEFASD